MRAENRCQPNLGKLKPFNEQYWLSWAVKAEICLSAVETKLAKKLTPKTEAWEVSGIKAQSPSRRESRVRSAVPGRKQNRLKAWIRTWVLRFQPSPHSHWPRLCLQKMETESPDRLGQRNRLRMEMWRSAYCVVRCLPHCSAPVLRTMALGAPLRKKHGTERLTGKSDYIGGQLEFF